MEEGNFDASIKERRDVSIPRRTINPGFFPLFAPYGEHTYLYLCDGFIESSICAGIAKNEYVPPDDRTSSCNCVLEKSFATESTFSSPSF